MLLLGKHLSSLTAASSGVWAGDTVFALLYDKAIHYSLGYLLTCSSSVLLTPVDFSVSQGRPSCLSVGVQCGVATHRIQANPSCWLTAELSSGWCVNVRMLFPQWYSLSVQISSPGPGQPHHLWGQKPGSWAQPGCGLRPLMHLLGHLTLLFLISHHCLS